MFGLSKRALFAATASIVGIALLGGAALAARPAVDSPALASATAPQSALSTSEDGKPRPNALQAVLDKLVQNGTITAAQRDAILQALKDETAQHQRGEMAKRLAHVTLEDAAKVIGISVEQLKQELVGKSLAQVAQAHGVTRERLVAGLAAAASERIAKALQENKIAQQQADRLRAALPDAIARFVDRVWEQPKRRSSIDAKRLLTPSLEEAAKVIGITTTELKQELAGKSLAQVAQAHVVSRDQLTSRLEAWARQQIAQALADKKITSEQAQTLRDRVDDAVARFVDHVWPTRSR